MSNPVMAGVYDVYEDAQITAKDLEAAGVPYEHLSILTNNSDGRAGIVDTPPGGEPGARVGAATGSVLGAGAGLLAGLALFSIPAIGPIAAAGWLITTLVGAGAGAGFGSAAGGLVGSLVEAGITKEDANFYAEAVRRGATVLLVKATPDHLATIEAILGRHAPIDKLTRVEAYRAGGWQEFDETAPAYTPDEIQREFKIHNPYRGPQL
jgi:hypothetical protein